MSAPIPSFFKIRCVLVILSLLLFFMLIGMTRWAFSACTDTQEDGSCFRIVATLVETNPSYVCSPPSGCTRRQAYITDSCTVSSTATQFVGESGYGYATFKKYICSANGCVLSGSIGGSVTPVNTDGEGDDDPASGMPRSVPSDCSSCPRARELLAAQCGDEGYTIIDEETCKGRCNGCVQEAEAQCPAPGIIVWNEDGDCSYNCSADTDGDGWPDIEDPDDDNDGMDDDDDPCPTNSDPQCVKPSGPDSDGDGTPDVSDPDADMDGDGIPNSEDDDDDGDGVKDVSDGDADPDGDGTLNIYDDDDDGDGIPDVDDPDADPDGDGQTNDEDDDDDNDGVPDVEDPDNDKYKSDEPAYSVNSTLPEMLKARFQQFLDDVKMSSLFSIPNRIKQGIPSGGDSSLTIDMGETFGGEHVVEYSGWSQGLAALNAIIYTVCSGIAIRIIILKR